MVIDTSVSVAMLQNEPQREKFAALIDGDVVRLMSAVTRVECTFVAEGRKGEAGREALELLLGTTGIEIVAVTADQTAIACEAFRRYGKGRHRAALNIGDCFAYALARSTGESLLAKGNDFPLTDLSLAG